MITRIHRANYSCSKKAKKKKNRTKNVHLNIRYSSDTSKSYWNFIDDDVHHHFVLFIPRTNLFESLIQHALNFHPAIRGFNEIYSQGVENEADWPLAYSRFNEWRWKTRMGKVKNSNFSVKRIYAAPPMGAPVQRGCSTMKIDDSSKLTCSNLV